MKHTEPTPLYALLDAIERCEERGHTYLASGGVSRQRSYAELMATALTVHGQLNARGLRAGQRLAVIAADASSFIPTFVAGVRAGLVLVPLAPPPLGGRQQSYAALLRQIAGVAELHAIVAPESLHTLVAEAMPGVPLLGYDELHTPTGQPTPAPAELTPDDTCFLQFTSGSTGTPKGVIVSYRNLAANTRAIMEHGLQITPRDVGVSWLPLHHDMGLIGKVLAPLAHRTEMVYLSTSAFIKNPNLWLDAISRHGGTISFAPNFAFAYVAKHYLRRPVPLHLGSLRVLGCGAEPINPEVLAEFSRCFAPLGLRDGVIAPSYGMAEATLAVSFSRRWHTLAIDRHACEAQRRALPCEAAGALRLVSCGPAFPEHAITVLDAQGQHLDAEAIGEIAVRGPSVSRGYFRNPEASAGNFVDGWLRTGDLGFLHGGEVYICGRVKDLIIVNGRNVCPQDVEWLVETLPGVRSGAVAAFAVPGAATEQVVVLLEARGQERGLEERIRERLAEEMGLTLHDVRVLPSGRIPKTTSGKVQRAKARGEYLAGSYDVEHAEASAEEPA
ncbi:fatty acyl-AMP ligase [Piscinibacter gummiphilus]|uniref:Fatty acyl-AMP ligase n=1 Tax=Piscinibacter gummiphilus TaxID=946333 RepID=A0ABZ0D266_9BURK|nr:fatty acyl-AMP ligase [Piscinibacter gummiphilus]WOB09405.1 fatty acyl-AMP ligase [Piscinibacter gummiphilus]